MLSLSHFCPKIFYNTKHSTVCDITSLLGGSDFKAKIKRKYSTTTLTRTSKENKSSLNQRGCY